MSRVESNTKQGGWFSSKNISALVEDNNSSDWFEIKFDVDATEFQYTAPEHAVMALFASTPFNSP